MATQVLMWKWAEWLPRSGKLLLQESDSILGNFLFSRSLDRSNKMETCTEVNVRSKVYISPTTLHFLLVDDITAPSYPGLLRDDLHPSLTRLEPGYEPRHQPEPSHNASVTSHRCSRIRLEIGLHTFVQRQHSGRLETRIVLSTNRLEFHPMFPDLKRYPLRPVCHKALLPGRTYGRLQQHCQRPASKTAVS